MIFRNEAFVNTRQQRRWELQGKGILQIRHDLPILIRCRPTNEECYIPSSLFNDGLAPYGKGARQTVDRTTGL